MATVQRRKNAWRVQVRRSGKAISATFSTRAEAEAWGIKAEGRILDGLAPEAVPGRLAATAGATAAEVLIRYADEISPGKRGNRWEQVRLRSIAEKHPLFAQPIISITGPDIAEWRDMRLVKVSASTVNRELCLISSVFTLAMKEWRLGLTVNPCSLVTKPRKPRPRTRRVSLADREKITTQLVSVGV